jgi:hypothetical protein
MRGIDLSTILLQFFAENFLNFPHMAAISHINEINHDQAADISQAELPGNLCCCFPVGVEDHAVNTISCMPPT